MLRALLKLLCVGWMLLVAVPAAHAEPKKPPPARRRLAPKLAEPVRGWFFDARLRLALNFGDDAFVPDTTAVGALAGVAITPLWLAEHGLGAGADFGYMYQGEQTGRGGAGMRRYPLVVSIHGLIRIAKHWHLRLAAGPQWEFSIKRWIGGGDLYHEVSHHLPDARGSMVELGALFVAGHVGVDVAVRYTHLRYHFPGALPPLNVSDEIVESGADGSTLGLVFSFHYLG